MGTAIAMGISDCEVTLADFGNPVLVLLFIALYFFSDFQSLNFERTWWRLFQKRVVRITFDIYDINVD